jgi:hypothetical protein
MSLLFLEQISATLKTNLLKDPASSSWCPACSAKENFSSFGIYPMKLPNPAKKCLGNKPKP